VGNGSEVTISEAVSTLSRHFDPEVRLQFGGEVRSGDPIHWRADVTKLRKLGYLPKVSLEDGLRDYANWYKSTSL
jgi:nucleoside-diphosphate-sugar epimerase